MPNGGGIPGIPLGESLQLPGETAPIIVGPLLKRILACEFDGVDAATCRGETTMSAKERRVALGVIEVGHAIPDCPATETAYSPGVLETTEGIARVVWMVTHQKHIGPLPPYHPSDPFWLLNRLDIHRYIMLRGYQAKQNFEAGCNPPPETEEPGGYPWAGTPEPEKGGAKTSGLGVGLVFVAAGLAIYAAGKLQPD